MNFPIHAPIILNVNGAPLREQHVRIVAQQIAERDGRKAPVRASLLLIRPEYRIIVDGWYTSDRTIVHVPRSDTSRHLIMYNTGWTTVYVIDDAALPLGEVWLCGENVMLVPPTMITLGKIVSIHV